MAIRIHIAAVRHTTPEALREASAPLGEVTIETANGWCWFSASVWSVGPTKILETLQHLEGPLLLATTEDACRWYMHLRRKGLEPYVTVHSIPPGPVTEDARDYEDLNVFHEEYEEEQESSCVELIVGAPQIPLSELTPLEFCDDFFEPYSDEHDEEYDEEEEFDDSLLGNICESFTSLGLTLSESILEQLEGIPEEKLLETFLTLHAEEMEQALSQFGIPHDSQTILDVLTGHSLTTVEVEWDIGDLPRFLAALKLGNHFDQMVAEAEQQDREDAEREPENFAAPVIKAMNNVSVEPLSGGPLSIPIEDAPLMFRAGYYTHRDVKAAYSAYLPRGTTFLPSDRVPNYLSIYEADGRLDIGISDMDVFIVPKSYAKLSTILNTLPDGTELVLHLNSETVTSQQFRGFIQDGQWHIESSAPSLPTASLADAMGLFRAGLNKEPITAKDTKEAESVLQATTSDYMFFGSPITPNDLCFSPPRRQVNALATLFFRQRFGDLWDCSASIEENKKDVEQCQRFNKSLEDAERLPVFEKPILEGRASKFYEVDLQLAANDKYFEAEIRQLPAVLKTIEALGYTHLGNIVCKFVGKCIICAFANAEEDTYFAHYILPFGMTSDDCFTHFEDGTSLTTTTTRMSEGSIKNLRILERKCESNNLAKLVEDHRKGIEMLARHGIKDTVFVPTLEGIATSMDNFLVKRLPDDAGREDSSLLRL